MKLRVFTASEILNRVQLLLKLTQNLTLKACLPQSLVSDTTCTIFNKKITNDNKGIKKKKQAEETKQSKPDLDMTSILELSERGFKITIIHTLRILMEKRH